MYFFDIDKLLRLIKILDFETHASQEVEMSDESEDETEGIETQRQAIILAVEYVSTVF